MGRWLDGGVNFTCKVEKSSFLRLSPIYELNMSGCYVNKFRNIIRVSVARNDLITVVFVFNCLEC